MSGTKTTSALAGRAVRIAAAALCASSAHAQQAPAEPPEASISDIVVTAQKRSENVQDVPISITVLGEQQLEQLHVQSLQDVARQTPSLVVVSAGPGENELIIRGISSVAGTTSTVGYYLDDTPIQPSSNAALLSQRGAIDPTVFDLSRVEVLRGPQGTLYGSSSMGGTVRYITNQPDLTHIQGKVHVEGSVTENGGPNEDVDGVVNIPLVENTLALRVTAYQRYDTGYIDRYRIDPADYLGVSANGGVKHEVNSDATQGFRAVLLYQPDPTLSVTPSVYYQNMRLGAPFQVDVPPGSLENLIQTRDVSEQTGQRSLVANLSVRKSFDAFELLSSTSYFDRVVKLHEDTSKVLDYFFSPPQTFVYPSFQVGSYYNKEFTEEARATSDFDGPFQVIGGVYFHHTFAPLASFIPDPAGYDAAFGSPFGGDQFYHGTRKATLTETAVFSEASLKLGYGVTARAGLRWFQVDQKFFQTGDGVFNGGFSSVTNTSSESGVNPKFNLEWQVDPLDMVYATASRGYRPGGPNNPAPAAVCGADVATLGLSSSELTKYNSDYLWNYEIGAKTTTPDDKLTVDGALYYIDWSQVQQQIVLGCGFNITANFGAATSKGGELEARWRPIPALLLSGGFGYTDATLSNAIPGSGAQAGDPLQDVPKWNGSASAEYTAEVADGYAGFALVNASYTSNSHALLDRTSPYYVKKGYSLLNLRIGIDSDAGWEAALFADNLLNTIAETDLPTAISADLPTTRRFAITQPRTIGLSFTYKF